MTSDDAPIFFAFRSDPEIMKFIDRPLASSIDEIHALIDLIDGGINSNSTIGWGIESRATSKFAGTASFHRIYPEHHRAEIGYMLGKEYWGKGLASEAVNALVQFGFSTMKLHSIEANVNPANSGSIRVLEKNGFVKEAHFKENYYSKGKFLDSAIYSLVSTDKL